jgi:serine/threonine-protein kinase
MVVDPDVERAQLRIGEEVGSWRLERVLGVGGMGSVFLGRRPDGTMAAVKLLHAHLARIDEVRKRFTREGPIGSALAALGPLCEGLPQIYESGMATDGTAYLAMEVLDGETLFDCAARLGQLPVDEVLWCSHKVLDVLVVAHAYGIIHRDLKPENLHVGRDGRLKVLDFGIARVLDGLPEGTGELPEKTATKTGTALGSFQYVAREQALGRSAEIDGRTDLYSLGATMFFLLSGRYVHGDLSDAKLVVAAATKPAPVLQVVAPSLPRQVCAVVDRALAFQRTERYPDAATMRFDINALRAGREPPYIAAIAEGRIRQGDRMTTR